MSVQSASAFLTLFSDQPTLRTQLYVMSPRTIEDLLRYAHSKTGHSFSKEDLQAAVKNVNSQSVIELKKRYKL